MLPNERVVIYITHQSSTVIYFTAQVNSIKRKKASENTNLQNKPPLCRPWLKKHQAKSLNKFHSQLAKKRLLTFREVAINKAFKNHGSCKKI